LACHRFLGTKRTASDARIWRGCWLMSWDRPFWEPRMAAALHGTGASSDVLRGYLRAEMIGPLSLLPPSRRPPADGRRGVLQDPGRAAFHRGRA
jgi:hypothetical protein